MFATIGGIRFEEWPSDPDDAFLITPNGLTGWFAGMQLRRLETPRPTAHGAFDAPGFLPARVVAIEGTILARTEMERDRRVDQLAGLLADGQSGRLSVQEDAGRVTWADVRLASCQIDRHPSGLEADFQVQFWSPDPRRYGDVNEFTAGQVLFHRGTVPAFPEVTVTGPFPNGYTISYRGRQFVVTAALASGAQHVIDMRTGWVKTPAGAVIQGAVSRAETLTVPPGLQTAAVTITGANGTGSLLVKVTDTFI